MTEKKQIIFINRVLWAGGAEKVIYDLAHGLNQDHYEPIVVTLFEQKIVSIHYDPAIQLYCLASQKTENRSSSTTKNWFGIKRYISRFQKLFHKFIFLPLLFLAGSGAKKSYYLHSSLYEYELQAMRLHDIIPNLRENAIIIASMEEATVRAWLAQISRRIVYIPLMAIMVSPYMPIIYPDPDRRSIEEWLFTNACKASDAIVAQTSRCAEDLVSSYDISAEHIRVIPSPVNCAEVRIKASESCHQEIKAMKGKTIFVHVERFAYQKGHRLLLKAVELLRKKNDNFVVLCIGDGELFEEIKNEIHVRGLEKHVLQLGRKLNPYPYIKASRALLLTSDLEGMPIILLDALSIGTPIISTDCPTGPREILEDGKYGILLPVGDAQAIADAMLQMIDDDNLFNRLSNLGPQRAARFDLPNIIHEWEQLFKEVQIDQEKNISA